LHRKVWLQEQLNALLENLIARFVPDGLFPVTAAAFGVAGDSVGRQKSTDRCRSSLKPSRFRIGENHL
jgi:hypothetical protein